MHMQSLNRVLKTYKCKIYTVVHLALQVIRSIFDQDKKNLQFKTFVALNKLQLNSVMPEMSYGS